ncbi:unnamed protein product [Symbiodinium sp. CCMP2456]|nr:unnamed protein product [Symbiodinium sp. CCMP2456]
MISMLPLLGVLALQAIPRQAAAFSRPNFVKLEADPGPGPITLTPSPKPSLSEPLPNDVPILRPLQQWPEWKRSHAHLCSLFRGLCMEHDSVAFKVSTMAISDLWEKMLGIGSGWFVLVVLACAASGLLGGRRMPESPQGKPSSASGERGSREGTCHFVDWWSDGPRITLASLKVFVTALLLVELLGLAAPEEDVLTLPEIIRRVRAHPYGKTVELGFLSGFTVADSQLLPRLTYLFMPNLNDSTADSYAAVFSVLRASLLASWCTFLALPSASWPASSWRCFVYGAFVYVAMASLVIMYIPCYDSHATCFFLLAACMVPSLETSQRSQAWLGKFLLVSLLAPFYLSAGVSKLRYGGWASMLSGSWLRPTLAATVDRSIFPGLNTWLSQSTWAPAMMSFGVLSAEFLLPVLVLCTASSSTNFSRWLRTCWILLVALFHVVCLTLVGPNFVRQIALLALSYYSVWHPTDSADKEVIEMSETRVWLCRVGYAVVLLMLWLCNQLWSDIDHIRGATPHDSYHDMLWPVGELSMYVFPSASSNYLRSLFLEIVIASLICLRIHFDVSQPPLSDKGGT